MEDGARIPRDVARRRAMCLEVGTSLLRRHTLGVSAIKVAVGRDAQVSSRTRPTALQVFESAASLLASSRLVDSDAGRLSQRRPTNSRHPTRLLCYDTKKN
jgi:hypothetical protein